MLMQTTDTIKADALNALEGMRSIVRREMVAPLVYVASDVSEPRYADAICGGRKHCAIGALWVGGGVPYRMRKYGYGYGNPFLPGTEESARPSFLRRHPDLKLALEALNQAAVKFADKRGINVAVTDLGGSRRAWRDPIEGLFEGYWGSTLTKRDLLAIIAAAKRNVKERVTTG